MSARSLVPILVLSTLLCPRARAEEKYIIGIMDFTGGAGVSQQTVDVLTDVVADKIGSMGNVSVYTKADMRMVLARDGHKRLAGCEDEACFIEEIGGALGIGWMVSGTLCRSGEIYSFEIRLIDVRTQEVASRVAKEARGSGGEVLDKLLEATQELFEKVADRLPLVPTVTIASKHRQSILWSPSSITVLTRQEIRQSGATLLPDLLRRVAGIDVYDLKHSMPVVGARALTDESNNLVLVLIDGREALIEFSGVTLWVGMVIDLEEIERIEIIRGPGSALYGANAFAGVVNIVTVADAPASGAEINLVEGEGGFYRNHGIVRNHWDLGDGLLSLQLTLGHQAKRSSSDTAALYYLPFRSHAVLRYQAAQDWDLSLHAGTAAGNGLFHTHVGDLIHENSMMFWGMIQGGTYLGTIARLKAQAYYVHFQTDYRSRASLRAFNVWIADFPTFVTQFPAADAQVQLDLQLSNALLVIAGANLRHVSVESEQFDPQSFSETRGAGFVHAQLMVTDRLQLSGGLRADFSTNLAPALSPRGVLVFRPRPNHALRVGYGLAFRKPSLYESHAHLMVDECNPAIPEIEDKMRTSLGNESLVSEKVHSLEAGWRARFLEDKLQASLDLYLSMYEDTISFVIELKERLGMPDIQSSTIRYDNEDEGKRALGGELTLNWQASSELRFWGNLGLRRVTWADSNQTVPSEPTLRANFGGGYAPATGMRLDVALHYVSSYSFPFTDPNNLLHQREFRRLGDRFLLIGRMGYRHPLSDSRYLEAGLVVRTPLGEPFREYPGSRMPPTSFRRTWSDWGGELLVRRVSLYLRCVLF